MNDSRGCISIILLLLFGLTVGFSAVTLLTYFLSIIGLIEFSLLNIFAVWGVVIILGGLIGGINT